MATRFYLPATSGGPSAPVSPAFDSAWDTTGTADRLGCRTTKGSTTNEFLTGRAKAVATDPANVLSRQFVSVDAFTTARTITGTVSWVNRCYESTSTADAYLQMVIRVVSSDGSTVRGTLYAGQTGGEPVATSGAQNQEMPQGSANAATRIWNAISLTSVACQVGDYLVIEVGARMAAISTSITGVLTAGESGSDFALTAGDTAGGTSGWVEFSDDLFPTAQNVNLDTGVVTAAGHDVTITYPASVTLDTGVVTAAGHDVTAVASQHQAVNLDPGAVTAAGHDVSTIVGGYTELEGAATATVTTAGSLTVTHLLAADPSTVEVEVDAALEVALTLVADPMTVELDTTGNLTDIEVDVGDTHALVLTVPDKTLRNTATGLVAAVGNAEPKEDIDFHWDGQKIWTERADADGLILYISVPIPESNAGTYTLMIDSADNPDNSRRDSVPIVVQHDPHNTPRIASADADPVLIPQTGDVRKWVLQDLTPGGLGSYIMPISPTRMGSPFIKRGLTGRRSTSPVGKAFIFQQAYAAREWTFAGFCPDQDMHDELVAYSRLKRRMYVIDHKNRAWKVTILGLTMTARRDYFGDIWAHDYEVRALVYNPDPLTPVG